MWVASSRFEGQTRRSKFANCDKCQHAETEVFSRRTSSLPTPDGRVGDSTTRHGNCAPSQVLPPTVTVREKGIDVLIALDIAEGAYTDAYDVVVLMSADSDLAPALERAVQHGKRVEVASWTSPLSRTRLRVPGRNIWCHSLTHEVYRAVHDDTDYTRPA